MGGLYMILSLKGIAKIKCTRIELSYIYLWILVLDVQQLFPLSFGATYGCGWGKIFMQHVLFMYELPIYL